MSILYPIATPSMGDKINAISDIVYPFILSSTLGISLTCIIILSLTGIFIQKGGKSYSEWLISIMPISIVISIVIFFGFLFHQMIRAKYNSELWGWNLMLFPMFFIKYSFSLILYHPIVFLLYKFFKK